MKFQRKKLMKFQRSTKNEAAKSNSFFALSPPEEGTFILVMGFAPKTKEEEAAQIR